MKLCVNKIETNKNLILVEIQRNFILIILKNHWVLITDIFNYVQNLKQGKQSYCTYIAQITSPTRRENIYT